MSTIALIAEATRDAVAAELDKIEVPEGTVVSDELKAQFAGAGVRGTITTLANTETVTLVFVDTDKDDLVKLEADEFFDAFFDNVNN